MLKKLLVLLMVLSSLGANAQGVVAMGGIVDCGKWLEARKNNIANYYEHYLLGLVDGFALGRVLDVWSGKGGRVTKEQFYFWMDNYCQKNPLNMTVTGAAAFANEMTDGAFNQKVKK